jgi:hypothetical protein
VTVPQWREGAEASVLPRAYRELLEVPEDAGRPLRAAEFAVATGLATDKARPAGPPGRAAGKEASCPGDGHRRDHPDPAGARDPQHLRTWIVLVNGAEHQPGLIRAEAARRGVTIWGAAWNLHPAGDPAAEDWVAARALTVLAGDSDRAAAEITADAGAAGVIEGACRHLIADRLSIGGARRGLDGASTNSAPNRLSPPDEPRPSPSWPSMPVPVMSCLTQAAICPAVSAGLSTLVS